MTSGFQGSVDEVDRLIRFSAGSECRRRREVRLVAWPALVMPVVMAGAAVFAPQSALAVAHSEDIPAKAGYTLTMSYDRPGLPVPHWQFRIQPGGAVEYKAQHAEGTLGVSDEAVRFPLSKTGTQKLTGWLAQSNALQPCETKTKNLARMGQKEFNYQPDGGTAAHCSFNYTDNKALANAAEYLTQTSYTLEEGATIERLHRYDRLGLDPVLLRLAAAAKEGKAPELAAIRPALESLTTDDQVLERVRVRAAELLQLAQQQ